MSNGGHAASRLVLGTAQLGMVHGIANRSGKPDPGTAFAIIETAYEGGVKEFDTAQAYGESERVLGRVFQELGITKDVRVTSKLDPRRFPLNESSLRKCVEESLEKLKIDQLEALRGLLDGGYVRNLGVSVYSPQRAIQALESDIFGVVHLPSNILDRRFADAGIFGMADTLKKRIYVRSAFLQGLILMDIGEVPQGLASVKPVLEDLDRRAGNFGLTRQALALMYLRDRFGNAKVIFGAEAPEQVKQNTKYWKQEAPSGFVEELESVVPELDGSILDPSRWFH